jgi:hypothetical protein
MYHYAWFNAHFKGVQKHHRLFIPASIGGETIVRQLERFATTIPTIYPLLGADSPHVHLDIVYAMLQVV